MGSQLRVISRQFPDRDSITDLISLGPLNTRTAKRPSTTYQPFDDMLHLHPFL